MHAYSPDEWQQILELSTTMPAKNIAEKFKKDPSYLRKKLRAHGVEPIKYYKNQQACPKQFIEAKLTDSAMPIESSAQQMLIHLSLPNGIELRIFQ